MTSQLPPDDLHENNLPPISKDAERAFLGSALIDPDVAARISSFVEPGDFYYNAHRLICEAMTRLAADSRPADFVTILDELRVMGKENEVQPAEIVEIMGATPTSLHADHYAKIVKMYAYNRRAIAIAGRIAEKAYATTKPEKLHAFIQEQLTGLAPVASHSNTVSWKDSHTRYLDILAKREEHANAGPRPARWH